VLRYIAGCYRCDVTVDLLMGPVIGLIGPLCVFVPLTGENALAANGLERLPQPADTGKQVDETERSGDRLAQERKVQLPQLLDAIVGVAGEAVAAGPPPDIAFVALQVSGNPGGRDYFQR
jgi:hypothetical protein